MPGDIFPGEKGGAVVRKIVSSIVAASVLLFAVDGSALPAGKKPDVRAAGKKAPAKTAKKPSRLPPTSLTGIASVYSYKRARRGASGEVLKFNTLIAAHRTLRFGTWVKVTNRRNGKAVIVRIVD